MWENHFAWTRSNNQRGIRMAIDEPFFQVSFMARWSACKEIVLVERSYECTTKFNSSTSTINHNGTTTVAVCVDVLVIAFVSSRSALCHGQLGPVEFRRIEQSAPGYNLSPVPILIITISSCLSSPKRSNKHYCIFFESCFDWYVECVESVLRFHESSRRSEEYYAPLMGERHAREKTLPLRFFWGEVAGVLGEVGSSRFSSLGVGETWSFRTLEGEDVQVDHIAFLWFLGADGKSLHFPLQQPCRKWLRNLPFHSIFLKLGWFVLVDSCCNFTVQENSTLPGGIGPSWNSHHFIVHYIIIVDRWWLLNQVLVLQLPVKCKAVSRICKNQIF